LGTHIATRNRKAMSTPKVELPFVRGKANDILMTLLTPINERIDHK